MNVGWSGWIGAITGMSENQVAPRSSARALVRIEWLCEGACACVQGRVCACKDVCACVQGRVCACKDVCVCVQGRAVTTAVVCRWVFLKSAWTTRTARGSVRAVRLAAAQMCSPGSWARSV